jgi:hypothetical protein
MRLLSFLPLNLIPIWCRTVLVSFVQEASSLANSSRSDLLSPLPLPLESWEGNKVFHAAQNAAEAETEQLQAQLPESDGHVVGKAPTPYSLVATVPPSLFLFLPIGLEAKLEKQCCHLG